MTKSYLADGLETHHTSQWTSLKTSFIEEGDGKFHFRRVTHLPKYATANSWVKAIYHFFSNIFSPAQHGHSWIELVQPIYSNGQYSGTSRVINVGFYLHLVHASKNRLEHTDYRALMPIPEREVHTLDREISREIYALGVDTIEEFQRINLLPKAEKERSPMKVLFFSSIYGGSCLSFANEIHHILNGELINQRGSIRRALVPRRRTWLLQNTEGFINRHTILTKQLLKVWYYLKRLHFPFRVNGNSSI